MNYSVLDDIPGQVDSELEPDGEIRNHHEDVPLSQAEFEDTHGDHLCIWNQCCHTPEEAKKQFTRAGGFSGTDINPQWRMQKMTEMFGPVGSGWGWKVHDRWSEDFPSGTAGVLKRCVFTVCSVWYIRDGKPCWTGETVGGTEAGRTPDEAYKMAVTDAIGKCMSAIGVGADIYLGQCNTKYQLPEMAYQPASAPQQPASARPAQRPVQQAPQQRPAPQPANAYSESVRPQQTTVPGNWQLVPLHFGKNQGKVLGALRPDQLSWYQDKWIASASSKKLSGPDLELYNALLESMGKTVTAQQEEHAF